MKPKKAGNKLPEQTVYPSTVTVTYTPTKEPYNKELPVIPDGVSLAQKLGVRYQTVWWLVMQNEYDKEADEGDKHTMYNKIVIPKDDGSSRVLHEPVDALKGVQKILLHKIFNRIECPDHFGAYVPNRSPVDMAKRHVRKPYKISIDLKDFFHWVHRNEVRDWMLDLGYGRTARDMIATLVTAPKYKPRKDQVQYVLPQGGPCSGMVANHIANRAIDQPVIGWLNSEFGQHNPVYSRYSDNIEISFDTIPGHLGKKKFSEWVVKHIREIANEDNFWINEDKTRFVTRQGNAPLRVLGINVGEKLNIPVKKFNKLRAMAHNAKHKGLESQAERAGLDDGRAFYDMLQSKLAYWAQVVPDKMEPLQQKVRDAWANYNNPKHNPDD